MHLCSESLLYLLLYSFERNEIYILLIKKGNLINKNNQVHTLFTIYSNEKSVFLFLFYVRIRLFFFFLGRRKSMVYCLFFLNKSSTLKEGTNLFYYVLVNLWLICFAAVCKHGYSTCSRKGKKRTARDLPLDDPG